MRRVGFTIVELIAALTLATTLLVTAHLGLSTMARWRTVVSQQAGALATEGEGMNLLAEHLLMAEAAESRGARFLGDPDGATFRSHCRTAFGWLEPCEVMLQVYREIGRSRLQFREEQGHWKELVAVDGPLELRYLARVDSTRQWRPLWAASGARPLAVAIVLARDTVVLQGSAP
jgi:hypothetical protein